MIDILPFSLPPSWAGPLHDELTKPYLLHLRAFLEHEKSAGHIIYPAEENIFRALRETPFEEVKVVIVGQDPYHGPGQAHGLGFSVLPTVPIPPSLGNIYKELQSDLGYPPPSHGHLLSWVHQGVLLINATLTVRKSQPLSHHKKGWEEFTDSIIECVAKKKKHVVFLLWGKNAQEKCLKFSSLLNSSHSVLTAAHPSPFSARNGFFGCRHFSKTNEYLVRHNIDPIKWQIE